MLLIASDTKPPQNMIDATQELIADAVEKGYLSKDYKLIGHRQAKATLCPGDALYKEIKTWPHYYEDTNLLQYTNKV